MNDAQLIRDFVEHGSDRAFQALVERHLPLVLGAARRITQSSALAEEVAQAVFILLARKAPQLGAGTLLPGWLHRTTRFVAARAIEAEVRRRRREETAATMHLDARPEETPWNCLAPDLDQALGQLNEADRNAVLLRYLEQRPLREVGDALGLSEEAAKKRVGRALDKLRSWFQRRGRPVTVAALAAGLGHEAAESTARAMGPAIAEWTVKLTEVAKAEIAGPGAATATVPGAGLAAQVWTAWRWTRIKLGLFAGAGAVTLALLLPPVVGWLRSTDASVSSAALTAASGAIDAGTGADGRAVPGPNPNPNDAGTETEPIWLAATGQRIQMRTLEVSVLEDETGDPVPAAWATHSLLSLDGRQRPRLAADSNGVVRLRVPERLPGAERMDQFSVWVHATNYARRKIHWLSTTGQVLSLVGTQHTVRLAKELVLAGTVVDSSGQGLPGVQLGVSGSNYRGYTVGRPERRAEDYSDYSVSEDDDGPERVLTDRAGRFRLKQYPSDLRIVEIVLRSPDGARNRYRTAPQSEVTPDDAIAISFEDLKSGTARLVVPRGHTVVGRVLTLEGEPIPGASVAEAIQWGNLRVLSRTDTDYFGQFALSNRPSREFILVASAAGFAAASTVVQASRELAPVVFRLPAARPLRGRVVSPSGDPLPDVNVSVPDLANAGTGFEWAGKTDADGRFVWAEAPTNEVVMGFMAGAFGYRLFRLRPGAENVVTLGGESTERVRVRGRVTDARSGQPIDEFTVKVSFDPTLAPAEDPGSTVHGAQGQFECEVGMDAIPVGIFPQWRVMVRADGYEPYASRFFQFEEGDQRMELALAPGGTMRVRLLLPSGQEVHRAEMAFAATRPVRSSNPGQLSGQREQADAKGIFNLTRPIGARALVIFHDQGWIIAPAKAGSEIEELVLRPWARVEGILLAGARAAGAPPAGESLVLHELVWDWSADLQVLHDARTDAEGRFAFPKLPAGEFVIARSPASGNSFGEPSVHVDQLAVVVEAGQTQAVEMASSGSRVKATLIAPGGLAGPAFDWAYTTAVLSLDVASPPPPVRANFVRESAHRLATRQHARSPAVLDAARRQRSYLGQVDSLGVVTFEDIPPGRYRLEVKVYGAPPVRSGDVPSQPRPVRARLKANAVVPAGPPAPEVAGTGNGNAIGLGTFVLETP